MKSIKILSLAAAIACTSQMANASVQCVKATDVFEGKYSKLVNTVPTDCMVTPVGYEWTEITNPGLSQFADTIYLAFSSSKSVHNLYTNTAFFINTELSKDSLVLNLTLIGDINNDEHPAKTIAPEFISSDKGVFLGDQSAGYYGVAYVTNLGNLIIRKNDGQIEKVEFDTPLSQDSLVSSGGFALFAVNINNELIQIVRGNTSYSTQVLTTAGPTIANSIRVTANKNYLYKLDLNGVLRYARIYSSGVVDTYFEGIPTAYRFNENELVASQNGVIGKASSNGDFKIITVSGHEIKSGIASGALANNEAHSLTYGGFVNNEEMVYAFDNNNTLFGCKFTSQNCQAINTWGGNIQPDSLISGGDKIYGVFHDNTTNGLENGRIFNTYHAGNGAVAFAPLTSTYKNSSTDSLAQSNDIFSVSTDGTLLQSKWHSSLGWIQTIHHYGQTDEMQTWLIPSSIVVDANNIVYGKTYNNKLVSYNAGTQSCYEVTSWTGDYANINQRDCYSNHETKTAWSSRTNAFNNQNVVLKFDITDANAAGYSVKGGLKIETWADNKPVIKKANWNADKHVTQRDSLALAANAQLQGGIYDGLRVRLSNLNHNSCLYTGSANSSTASSWSCWNDKNFTWNVILDSGKYILKNEQKNRCLLGGSDNKLRYTSDCNESLRLHFEFLPKGDSMQIKNSYTNKCVTLNQKNDMDIHLETCTDQDNQLFRVSILNQ